MDEDKVEMARTEAVFREVNERIAETAQRFLSTEADFVCECADPECSTRIELPLVEYQQVRESPTTFLLAHGHERPTIERVVRRRRGYSVVEKVNAVVVRIVRGLDRRSGRAEIEPA
jgi:hypothetical protein